MKKALLVCVLLAGSGCSLLVSTSGLTGGGPTPGDEGGAPTDGGKGAGAEAGGGSLADARPFCASLVPQPKFCADFDEGPFDPKAWDTVLASDGGALAVDQATATSPPSSLVATTPPGGTGSFRPVFVERSYASLASLRIEADVLIERAEPVTTTADGARVVGFQAVVNCMLDVYGDGTLRIQENWGAGGGTKAFHGSGTYVVGQWFHVAIELGAAAKSVAVTIDGKTISDGTPLAGPFDPTKTTAVVGLYYAHTNAAGWTARYDNVVIDAK